GDRQLAGWKSCRLIEDVEQSLAPCLPPGGRTLGEERERDAFSERKLAPRDRFNALAAIVGGSGHSLSLWARAAVQHHRRRQRDPPRIHRRYQLELARGSVVPVRVSGAHDDYHWRRRHGYRVGGSRSRRASGVVTDLCLRGARSDTGRSDG